MYFSLTRVIPGCKQVSIAVEGLEKFLGFDPNDPIVPFFFFVGSSVILVYGALFFFLLLI